MRHDCRLEGRNYALRPVAIEDAGFMVKLRTDPKFGRYLNTTSSDVGVQVAWLARHFEQPGDFYFVVFDRRTGEPAGLIALYDQDEAAGTAEWGRWIVPGSPFAAIESALLIYRFAFETLELASVYSRTVADNRAVVSFHDSCGARRVRLLPDYARIGDLTYDSVEHAVDREGWPAVKAKLETLIGRR